MLNEPPLIGREQDLLRLNSFLDEAMGGSGKLILISGEAGIGKTRLAKEFEKGAESRGCKVLFGGTLPSAQIPYHVFFDALNDLFEERKTEDRPRSSRIKEAAKKATPELLKAVPIVGLTMKASASLMLKYDEQGAAGQVSKEHVLFRTLDLLRKESAKRPLVIHLDDMQWADSMSIAMLHFLARNCRDLKVMIIGTFRSEEVMNKEEGIHPFLESIRIMKREGLVEEIELKPLAEGHMGNVVTTMLERPVHEAVLERIFKESGGSPLFAVETVRLLFNSGALVEKEGKFRIAGSLGDVIPSSVKEVIVRRIERTSKDERKALDYASVIGMTFDPGLLAESVRKDRMMLLETLEHLENDHQLVKELVDDYIFTHEKVCRFTYDGLSKIRRKEIHRTVGNILERQMPNDPLLPVLAHHFDSAGDNVKAIDYSLSAARFCYRNHAVQEAIHHFKRVLDLCPDTKDHDMIRLDAMEGLADAYDDDGDIESLAEICEKMARFDLKGAQKRKVYRKLAACWIPFRLGKGSKTKCLEYIELALNEQGVEHKERAEIAAMLKSIASSEGDRDEAIRQGQISEDSLRAANEFRDLSLVLIYNTPNFMTNGDMSTVKEKLREAQVINERNKDVEVSMELSFHRGVMNMHMGNVDDALRDLKESEEIAKRLGLSSMMCIQYLYQSYLMSFIGEYEKAIVIAAKSREYAEVIKRDMLKAGADSALAHANFMSGRSDECQRYASEAYDISTQFGNSKSFYIGTSILANAEALSLSENWIGAKEMYINAIEMFRSCTLGKLMEGMTHRWFGEALLKHGEPFDARIHLEKARDIFDLLGNEMEKRNCSLILS